MQNKAHIIIVTELAPIFKLRRMNVYMHTVATVTAMGNKELFQTYDEVRSKHPKELKARVKIGAGSGKKSVLDVLVAFMTKRANLFGVSAVTARGSKCQSG